MNNQTTELYRYYDEDSKLLYVGISISAIQRLAQHRIASFWYEKAVNVTIERFETRCEALAKEREAILKEKPIYNVQHNKQIEDDEYESPRGVNSSSIDSRNLIRRTVDYRPIYKTREVAAILYGSETRGKDVKSLIDNGSLGAILIKESERKNSLGIEYLHKEYIVTGWQLIAFIEALELGEVSI